jgi:hypothetical protein
MISVIPGNPSSANAELTTSITIPAKSSRSPNGNSLRPRRLLLFRALILHVAEIPIWGRTPIPQPNLVSEVQKADRALAATLPVASGQLAAR